MGVEFYCMQFFFIHLPPRPPRPRMAVEAQSPNQGIPAFLFFLSFFLFFLFDVPRGLRDLSSPTRVWTQAHGSESAES